MTKTMNDILGLDEAKCREIVDIKEKYIKGELTFEEAREIILQRFDSVTPQEFAFGEQMLKDDGIDDETMHEKWMTSSGFSTVSWNGSIWNCRKATLSVHSWRKIRSSSAQ